MLGSLRYPDTLASFTAMADNVDAARKRYDSIREGLTDPAEIEATYTEQCIEQDQLAALIVTICSEPADTTQELAVKLLVWDRIKSDNFIDTSMLATIICEQWPIMSVTRDARRLAPL